MDADNDWTTTGLFSPSKAKAHQAQAKDWAFVDDWLTKRFTSKRLPPFERNEDTLEALLSLATLNDAADEQRSSIERVEKSALSALAKKTQPTAEGLHELILDHLDTADLDLLAKLSVMLDTSPSALDIGTAIMELHDSRFSINQQTQRADAQLQALKSEQQRLESLLVALKDDSLQAPVNLPSQTTEWTRSSKHLRVKVTEYDDRLASALAEPPPTITFEDVAKRGAELDEQAARLAQLSSELEAYQSLPSDSKAARAKLESARDDLRALTKQREGLFETMADR